MKDICAVFWMSQLNAARENKNLEQFATAKWELSNDRNNEPANNPALEASIRSVFNESFR